MPVREWQSREAALIGEENIEKLARASVLVFGAGGVGSYVIESLARAGIGRITVVDGDRVAESNINRQLIADTTTVGRYKSEVAAERVKRINPDCTAVSVPLFADASNTAEIIASAAPDFIADAIDCVTTKLLVAEYAAEHGIPLISSMGTGNKLNPSLLEISDISKTAVCPLARVMRRELRQRGITRLPVLFSTEQPVRTGMRTPASISFVPSVGGLMIGGYIVRKIIGK